MATISKELIEKFRKMDTTSVSDALDRLGIKGGCQGILPQVSGIKMVRTAFTVRYRPCGTVKGTVGDFLDDVQPGQTAKQKILEMLGKGITMREARKQLGYHHLQSKRS